MSKDDGLNKNNDNNEEWTTQTYKKKGRGRKKKNLHQNQTTISSSSNNSPEHQLSTAMNQIMNLKDEHDDTDITAEQVQTALEQCKIELLQSEFYQTVLTAATTTTTALGCDDGGNGQNNSGSTSQFDEIVCYGIGNFYTAHPSAPLWQLSLAVLLQENCNGKNMKDGQHGTERKPIMKYFEPRMTSKEEHFLKEKLQIEVISTNERGCHPIINDDMKKGKTLFFMPHCPMALYSNVLHSNWNCLDNVVVFGNSFSNYLDGTQTKQNLERKKRGLTSSERIGSSHKKSNNNNNKSQHHNQKLSKALSWALRHNAHKIGLTIREDGYVPVQEILKSRHPKLASAKPTMEAIQHVVEDNDKQRFKLEYRPRQLYYPNEMDGNDRKEEEETILCIRANQGHSMPFINPDLLLRQLTRDELQATPCIVHGTYLHAWKSIQNQGLSKRNRTHIHFASGLPEHDHVISGMRKSANVYIFVNAMLCADDDIPFYESDNGVLLSAGIDGILPTKYFSHVVEASTGQILLDQRTASDLVRQEKYVEEETSNNQDHETPPAHAIDILHMLQPHWKESTITITKKDVVDRSAKFEQAFNDSSLTVFRAEAASPLPPKPEMIVGIEESGEVV